MHDVAVWDSWFNATLALSTPSRVSIRRTPSTIIGSSRCGGRRTSTCPTFK